jgi:hypothetical protein
MAVSHLRNTPITGKSYTTPVDATVLPEPVSGQTPSLTGRDQSLPRRSLTVPPWRGYEQVGTQQSPPARARAARAG